MKKLVALLLAALLMMSFACAEEITAVETTIPLSQPDSPVTITLTYTGTLDIEFSPYAPADQVRATVRRVRGHVHVGSDGRGDTRAAGDCRLPV